MSSGNVESHGFVQQLRRTLKGGRMQLRKENDGLGVTTEVSIRVMTATLLIPMRTLLHVHVHLYVFCVLNVTV